MWSAMWVLGLLSGSTPGGAAGGSVAILPVLRDADVPEALAAQADKLVEQEVRRCALFARARNGQELVAQIGAERVRALLDLSRR